jgi:hypothetical protein
MALSKIDVANMLTGATPVANGGTALTSGFKNGADPRTNAKPIIYNGNMAIAQRTTSETGVGTAQVFVTDRFRNQPIYGSTAPSARFTITQSTTVPSGQGFFNSLKWDCTTAQGSLTSDTGFAVEQRVEGFDVQAIKKGTSSAEKLTLAFWVRSNKTGTYICELVDNDNTRHCSQSYTISDADTWEKKVVNFPADTTGAFGNDNALSLKIRIWVAAGSDFTGGTLATSFASVTNANSAVGQVNLADNTSNEWYITGIQLEIGEFSSTTLPPFQFETVGDSLRRCLRYCYQISGDGSNATDLTQITGTGGAGFGVFRFPVQMRASPTQSDSGDNTFTMYGPNTGDPSSLRGDRTNPNSCGIVTDTSITSGNSVNIRVDTGTSNFIRFDAEL